MNPISAGRLIAAVLVLPMLGFAACAAPPDTRAAMEMKDGHDGMSHPPPGDAVPGVPTEAGGMTYKIGITNFVFDKGAIIVPVGATVTWVNEDDIPHNIVAKDLKSFHSHALDTNDAFSFTFTKAGEFGYFCGLHPKMTGKIIVKAS
ncbi:MAG TPA: cupredoxin family copper-binding protein [Hyphomonadaceae bacterium]|jgi:plastocyanin|nr:cupredoxin family copper-binding protein [Hyphomonadaceae bacterium]